MRNLFILLILAVFVITSCSQDDTSNNTLEAKPISQIQEENGIPVRVQTVELTTLEGWKTYTGDVQGAEQVTVYGKLDDNIQTIKVKTGDRIEKDQVVAIYETDNPQANYRQAKIALDNAEKMFSRMKAVFDEGGISQQQMDDVEVGYKVALENFNATSKMINVKSPISGQVVDVFVETGEPINPGDPICKIAKINQLKTEVEVDESDLYYFQTGQHALVTWNALPDETFNGKIDRISISADPETRTFTVDVLIDNEDEKLRPGAFVKIAIQTTNKPDVIAVDNRVIEFDNEQPFVYIIDNNIARKTTISLGEESGEFVEITNGLNLGDALVVEGQTLLADAKKTLIVE